MMSVGKKNLSKNLWGAIAVSFAAILWGLDGVVLTPRLYNLKVDYVVFIFHALPFLIMNIFLHKEYAAIKNFKKQDYLLFFLVALFGGAIGTLAIVKALFLVNFQKLTIVVLLQKLQPVFGIALAAIFLKESFGKRFMLWAILAILSAYTLAFGFSFPDMNTDAKTIYASLYALLAAFSFGSSTVVSKKLLGRFQFHTSTFYRYGFTSLIMLAIVFFNGSLNSLTETTTTQWWLFLLIAVSTGSGAIFIYYAGLQHVKATVATMCELFFPLSAVIFDYFVNDSLLTGVQWASAFVLIVSIIMINIRK